MGERVFIYDGREFPDPDPDMSVDDVRRSLTDFFPELSNAETKQRKEGDRTVVEFTRRVGTKGTQPVKACITCGGPLEERRFIDAWNTDGTPSIEDCTEGPYCRTCKVVWVQFVKDEDAFADSVAL